MKPEITLEQVEQFVQMLTGGDLPDGMNMANQPQLTARQAFGVVWYLQEGLGIIPDRYEQCDVCECIFDSDCSGHHIDPEDDPKYCGGWYDSVGVTREMIQESGGAHVCSQRCDVQFWRDRFPEWRMERVTE